jgi:hypothetical protein
LVETLDLEDVEEVKTCGAVELVWDVSGGANEFRRRKTN